jgi:hypothetical protein
MKTKITVRDVVDTHKTLLRLSNILTHDNTEKLELLKKYKWQITQLKAAREELKTAITNKTEKQAQEREEDLEYLEYIDVDIESLEEAINALENE